MNVTNFALRDFFPDAVSVVDPLRGSNSNDESDFIAGLLQLSGATGVQILRFNDAADMFDDPLRGIVVRWAPHGVLDVIERELTARTPAMQARWHKPSRLSEGASLIAKLTDEASASLWVALEFEDYDGPAAARAVDLLPALATIIQSHVALQDQLRSARAHEHAALSALDRDDCGTIALKADNSVLFANAAAQAMLAEETVLHVRRNILRPTRYQDAVRFQVALDCVVANAQPGGKRRGAIMMLSHPSLERPLVAVLVPVPPQAESAPAHQSAAAIVHLIRPDRVGMKGLDQLCALYGLTPVETRLVGQLVGGNCVVTAASQMRIKADTARAYLKQIFAKTGTNRQSQLLNLIARSLPGMPGDLEFEAV